MIVDDDRLRRLLRSAERMAGRDVDHRVELSGENDELDALGFAINVIVGELSHFARGLERAKEEAEVRSAELASTQESLVRSERLALLGQLAGGVAHQIRNPLAAIMNATFVLTRHTSKDAHPNVEGAIRIIQDEVRHANSIITGLLDFARVRGLSVQPTSMVELVESVLAAPWIPKSVRVERALATSAPIDIDPDQVREALVNVVRNAVEAMPDGGVLKFELTTEVGWVVMVITDSGPGIASEMREHLFEPLHSTKPLGVGLGLVAARRFVEAHGGRISFVPTAEGACFEVRLPFATA